MRRLYIIASLCLLVVEINAQHNTKWHHKKCVVVLTYDDGLDVHLANVVPALDSLGLKGTFYLSDYYNSIQPQIPGWKKAAAEGHELGNHTIWHPCVGGFKGREFVTADYDLRNYTVKRMADEIRTMNNFLHDIDGKTKRTFAFPCGDAKIHDTAYIDGLKNDFVAARGVQPEMTAIDTIDIYNIPCFPMNGQSGDQMIDLVKEAMSTRQLLVFLFHGVGGEHPLNVSVAAHSQLLHFLKENQKNIWITRMIDVAEYIKKHQRKPK